MTLTAEQLATRRQYLTASDVAAVLGLNPYRNAADVYVEKTMNVQPTDDTDATELGTDLEDPLVTWAAREMLLDPSEVARQVFRVASNNRMGATLDGLPTTGRLIFEAKTSGLTSRFTDTSDWGTPRTDQVPDHIIVQAISQLICVPKAEAVVIPALIGGKGRHLYIVPRNDDQCRAVEEAALGWWNRHVVAGVPPEEVPSIETVRRVIRRVDVTVPIDQSLVQAWLDAKAATKAAEESEEFALAELSKALGDASAGECELGVFAWREENAGRRIRTDELKQHHPEIYEQFSTASTRRVARFKARKGTK